MAFREVPIPSPICEAGVQVLPSPPDAPAAQHVAITFAGGYTYAAGLATRNRTLTWLGDVFSW